MSAFCRATAVAVVCCEEAGRPLSGRAFPPFLPPSWALRRPTIGVMMEGDQGVSMANDC